MSHLSNEIIEAFHRDNFLQVVYEKLGKSGNRSFLEEALVSIHNDGLIDVIACFRLLENKPNIGYDFFLTRRVFEKTLPHLNSPVKPVMECVLHLVHEAGQNMTAGLIFEPFIEFCATEPSRPKESLVQIEADVEQLADLLSPAIVAGARIDIRYYLHEAIRLSSHDNIEIRKRAVFSLGKIKYSQDIELCNSAIASLKHSLSNEDDDHLLGNLIKSAFSLFKHDNSQVDRIIDITNNALLKGGDISLHAASELFGFNFNELPENLIDSLLDHLRRVKPQNKGTLENIDYGLIKLLNRDDPTKGIEFLEAILTANSDEIPIDIFDIIIEGIRKNENVLNKLVTRWFLRGDRILCDFIRAVINKSHGHSMLLKIDPSELVHKDQLHIIFVARKAVGYLFFNPVTAASAIISLMHNTNLDETLNYLGKLLFDPLLLNFPGKLKEYLMQMSESETGKTKSTIKLALENFDKYLKDLKSTGIIPELHPTQTQRDAYRRRFSRLMSESFKEAEKNSVILPLISKSVLLYGRKSINYVYSPDGKSNRMEIPLHSHGTETEVPQIGIIDHFGLDYVIRIFRSEQIKA